MKKLLLIAGTIISISALIQSCAAPTGLKAPDKPRRPPIPFVMSKQLPAQHKA